jgi:hypothetical protein
MNYFFIYLAIGFTYALGVMVHHNFTKKEGDDLPKLSENSSIKAIKELFSSALALIFGTLIWPILLYLHIVGLLNPPYKREGFLVKLCDLLENMSIEEIEQKEIIHDPLNSVSSLPFGHLNAEWAEFKNKCITPAEIWSFKSEYEGYSETVIKFGYVAKSENNEILTVFMCSDYPKKIDVA